MVCIQDDSVIKGGNKLVACIYEYLWHNNDYSLSDRSVYQTGGAYQHESRLVCGEIMNPVPCSGSAGPKS